MERRNYGGGQKSRWGAPGCDLDLLQLPPIIIARDVHVTERRMISML